MRTTPGISRAFAAAIALVAASGAFAGDDATWSVKKSSGEVWMGASGVQQVSVRTDEVLKPGDTIRTGRNGRVLLVRGEESILIAPNSVIGLPAEKKDGLATTITQQAGSILLEVEKKNVRHFEVETPYLAAIVKGTQFRVTVNASGATVDVVRGQVEVSDFKSGQIAQVMPGQHASAFSHGHAGLALGGPGTLQPIQHGQPRASTIDRVPVPRNGLSAPGKPGPASTTQQRQASGPRHGLTRISSALGEVRLNVHRVTHGLARNSGTVHGTRSAGRDSTTVWDTASNTSNSSQTPGSGINSGSSGGSSGAANSASGGSAASTVATVVGAATGGGNGNGNGNGNSNNGNNGNNGNHYGWRNGNGNGGNNGNNGNGNGRGNR
jgi:hypothetical protein